MKRAPTEDDECYHIDDLDDTINKENHKLLENDQLYSFLLKDLEESINQSDIESCSSIGDKFDNNSDVEMSIHRMEPVNTPYSKAQETEVNTPYSKAQETEGTVRVKNEHLYLASANEIDEKKPKLKDLTSHLEYAYLHSNKSFPIIISSRLYEEEKYHFCRGIGYESQRIGNVVGARETVEQADGRDDTDDESEDHPDVAADSGPIFNTEPVQKNDDDDDLANERELLASLIETLKCEIDDSKNRNKFLETSNKILVDKLKGEIKDFKTKNKSLESSNSHFKEANNKLSETNALMYNDLKKFQAELDRCNDVKYASKVEIDCAKAKGDLISYKIESQKSFNKYTLHTVKSKRGSD
nr:hypothetical protein [Tanacetum cinerariifolium]GEY08212.1 hypothetical protein [Tanacetum cinerariifolium]GEY17756.1 hypothetical protein [Tanacetum cinerariifolium]